MDSSKVQPALRRFAAKNGISANVEQAILESVREDMILPNVPSNSPIKFDMLNDEVSLCVGPRDWQWDRKTGELNGCGTYLG